MNEYNPILTGKRIKLCREERGLTLDNIAISIGIARSTVQRYEAGTIKRPKLPVIDSIAKILDVDPSWLLNKTNQRNSYYTNVSLCNNSDDLLPTDERLLLSIYRQVNTAGQNYIMKQAEFAFVQKEYQKPSPSASGE
ncbi:helix-turn-helix domain-containing protein [uncultured Dysosmobacter sp.]|uniref:helix-turn-helix domain-containing protein n=1 Tax=uncultured Dysosmobacter sp. TaxID=2591384 RepID=UPI00261EF98C|nr:helix-turn-helix transcriptional regulator [uncultured Dysosmobacter sp.]